MKKYPFLLLFSLASTSAAVAQINKEVDILQEFKARIKDADKIDVRPVLPPVDTARKPQSYSVPNKIINVDYSTPKIRPLPMATPKTPPQYQGFAKLGYGFPSSPYGEFSYRHIEANNYIVGLRVKHHSANDKKLENQRFSMTGGEATGTLFTRSGVAFDGHLGFDNNTRQFYGYNHERQTYSREDTKQFFNTLSAGAKVYNSLKTVADFNYSLGVNFYRTSDNYANAENNLDIKAEGTKWFNEKHPLSLVIRTDFSSFNPQSGKIQTLNNVYLQPSFTWKGDNFSIKAGANLVSVKDIFYPMPDIEAAVSLAGAQLQAFAGWKGDFTKNSFRSITAYNPFINPDTFKITNRGLEIRNTQKTDYYGGVKGSVALFDYAAQVSFSQNNDLALFLADTTDRYRRFQVLYDTGTIFNVRGSVIMHPVKDLEITATASQNIYRLNKQEAAWGLPSLDINVGARYNVMQKGETAAVLKGGLFIQNGVNYIDNTGKASRLDGLFDVNIGGEYWFSKNVGGFLDLNNLLNLKRERWQHYPTFGLNVLLGVTARF